jgi:hypothetical protein
MFRLTLGLLLGCCSLVRAAESDLDCLTAIERSYYRVLKPTAQELRYRQIPWMMDLDAAVKQAKKENRPLFIWATDDEPLERC